MFSHFIGVSYFVQTPAGIAGYGFGASVLRASVIYMLPFTLMLLAAAQFGGMLVRGIGARLTLAVGAAFGAAGFVWLALAHDTTASVILAGIVVGVAISLGYAAMPALIVVGVPLHQTGIANGINSISRSTGMAIGSAVITSLLASRTFDNLPRGTPALPAERQYTLSFALATVAFLLVIGISMVGLATRSRHRRRRARFGERQRDRAPKHGRHRLAASPARPRLSFPPMTTGFPSQPERGLSEPSNAPAAGYRHECGGEPTAEERALLTATTDAVSAPAHCTKRRHTAKAGFRSPAGSGRSSRSTDQPPAHRPGARRHHADSDSVCPMQRHGHHGDPLPAPSAQGGTPLTALPGQRHGGEPWKISTQPSPRYSARSSASTPPT
ncbi:MFS transporter [Streptomyces avermitilis]|uniref:MFS transporter n=1 Tax=Streptomyces avermitilis TaxID=33903 RepID=UPI0033A5D5DD